MRRGRTRTPCRSGRAPSAVRGAGEHCEVSPNCATRQGAGHATGPPTRICRAETLVRFAAGRVRGSGEGATGALRAPSQRRRAQKGAARWGWRMSQSGRPPCVAGPSTRPVGGDDVVAPTSMQNIRAAQRGRTMHQPAQAVAPPDHANRQVRSRLPVCALPCRHPHWGPSASSLVSGRPLCLRPEARNPCSQCDPRF